jgi:hypothetical protein
MFKRFWKRQGLKGTLIAAAIILAAIVVGGNMLRHGAATGGSVTAHSGRYSYTIPKGWTNHSPCGKTPVSGRGFTDDGCPRPDDNAPAGAYLVSQPVAAGTTAEDVAATLAGRVTGYQPCAASAGADACLRAGGHPDQKGELKVRVDKTLAIAMLCLRTDRSDIQRGCDLVWNHIKITS